MSLSRTEYQHAIETAVLAARLVTQIDIPEILRKIEMAESIGGIIDPTLYREKAGAMREDKEVLEAALPLYRLGKRIEQMAHAAAERAIDGVVSKERSRAQLSSPSRAEPAQRPQPTDGENLR